MEFAEYTLEVDTGGDGTYASDLSAYLMHSETIEWSIGMNKPFDSMARDSTLECALLNNSNQFSPSHASALAGFQVGQKWRLKMTYNATTATKYTGRILPDGLEPSMGIYLDRLTKVRGGGFMYILDEQLAYIAVQQDITTGSAIQQLLANMSSYPPADDTWFLGIDGYTELGETTILGSGVTDYANLDTGDLTYNYFGDNIGEDDTIYEVIKQIVFEEGGLFWIDETGKIQFRDSGYLITQQAETPAGTLTGTDIREGEDKYGSTLINQVSLTYYPRVVGTPLTRIGAYTELLVFDAYIAGGDNSITLVIPYTDQSTGIKIGALDVVDPVAGIDWTAHPTWDSGVDISNYFIFTVEDQGTQMSLTMSHTYPGGAYIASIYVRGTPLTDYGRATITVDDNDSRASYGLARASYRCKYLDDSVYATDLANWILHQFSEPVDVLESLTFIANKSAAHMALARDLTVGDMIVVSEGQTGISSAKYFVVGLRHMIQNKLHQVEMILRAAPPAAWILGEDGFTELGETTILGLGN